MGCRGSEVRIFSPRPIPHVKSDTAKPSASSWRDEPFRRLVEGVADYAIFMLDPEGRVMSWNEGARRIKGYEAREIIGKHFSEF